MPLATLPLPGRGIALSSRNPPPSGGGGCQGRSGVSVPTCRTSSELSHDPWLGAVAVVVLRLRGGQPHVVDERQLRAEAEHGESPVQYRHAERADAGLNDGQEPADVGGQDGFEVPARKPSRLLAASGTALVPKADPHDQGTAYQAAEQFLPRQAHSPHTHCACAYRSMKSSMWRST